VKWLALCAILLVACGGAGPALTPDDIESALTQAGAGGFDRGRTEEGSPVPQSYTDHATFTAYGKPGQYFLCDMKKNCDAIFAYFDALKALAGPYTYQSGSGRVVIQLNSGLLPDQARLVAGAIQGR